MTESTEGKNEPHPADDPEPTTQCEYVFDRDSARWRARRHESTATPKLAADEK